MFKKFKRVITILVIFSLIYANFNMAVMGLISYAIEDVQETQETNQETKKMELVISEFYKNNMQEKRTNYVETITLNLSQEEGLKEVIISDLSTQITSQSVAEETTTEIAEQEETEVVANNVKIFYTSTKINKTELMTAIGEQGTLKIQYVVNDIENEETTEDIEEEETNQTITVNEQETEIPVGTIVAESGEIKIDSNTNADTDGYITIIYPENTVSQEILIYAATNQIEDVVIENNRKIEIITEIDKANYLRTIKKIIASSQEEELFSSEVLQENPIFYTKSVAEIGIDKQDLSTSIENDVTFTISMLTHSTLYDLYKNPEFIIEMPQEVTAVEIDSVVIMNENSELLKINSTKKEISSSGNQVIKINLTGEQVDYTETELENVYIQVKTTIKTEELLPTISRNIKLYYKNENVTSYDGINKVIINQEVEDSIYGETTIDVNLISNSEIIVQTEATAGEKTVKSFKDNYENIIVESGINEVLIEGTVINNTGSALQNMVIIGSAKNIGEITAVGVNEIYYTENGNAGIDLDNTENAWSTDYTTNVKKYLLVINNLNQTDKIVFNYIMTLPEDITIDTTYDAVYEVYDNNESVKTSKIEITQETKRVEEYEDNLVKSSITFPYGDTFEVGERASYKITLTNISEQKIEGIDVTIIMPEELTRVIVNSYKIIGEETIPFSTRFENNLIYIDDIYLEQGETIEIPVSLDVDKYVTDNAEITIELTYLENDVNLSSILKIVEPSLLETTISSNKEGKELDYGEEIIYTVTVKNSGKSSAEVDIKLPESDEIKIYSFKITNKTTGEVFNIVASNITGVIDQIEVNSGETLEIIIKGIVQKIENNDTIEMYLVISGTKVKETKTETLINTIIIENDEEIKQPENSEDEETDNPNEGEENNNVNKPNDEENKEETDNPIEDEGNERPESLNNVSGLAWIDADEDGIKDKTEMILKDVQVILVDTITLEEVETKITDSNGKYEFTNIPAGTYILKFKFNTNTFKLTKYQNGQLKEDIDSDVVSVAQGNETINKTEKFTLKGTTEENINIGLVVNRKFDMSIDKTVTKIIVNNEQGTNTYNFENIDMAKVEIPEDYIKGSLILVEYEITIKNTGEISGYVKQISDKIPEGMEFNSELNTLWYQGTQGNLYCNIFENEKLEPEETRTVKLVLTKEMEEGKLVSTINTVQLEETFNEYLIKDKEEENDIADATVIISIKTGGVVTYTWLIIVVIIIIGIGAFGAIKIVKKETENLK